MTVIRLRGATARRAPVVVSPTPESQRSLQSRVPKPTSETYLAKPFISLYESPT